MNVIVGGSYWALNGVNMFSANLVRGLLEQGIPAHVLLTEEDSALIRINDARMQRPAGVPFVELPIEPWRSWGGHWGALIRYLEDRAPCVYIPNSDWRHSSVCPLLSDGVKVIGVVHSDDLLHYDHVTRLGRYWDAIATTSSTIARKTIALDASLRDRTRVIPIGVDVPPHPPGPKAVRAARPDQPLTIIYPGSLKQHQKRVLDLPKIVQAAAARGVPVTLTIAGGGPDEGRLRDACAPLVAEGLITFLGVVDHERLLPLLEAHDVFIMTSEFEGMPNALLEAMGRGCVPLVTDMESAIPDVVTDGVSGHIVPIGAIDAFVDRLARLGSDPVARRQMSRAAFDAVSAGKFRVDDMVRSYKALVEEVLDPSYRRTFVRPRGVLNHPPAQVDGVSLFPVQMAFDVPEVGAFPDARDFREFAGEIVKLERPDVSWLAPLAQQGCDHANPQSLRGIPVIVDSGRCTDTPTSDLSASLVRALRALGVDARLLVTEEHTNLVERASSGAVPPSDIPCDTLPVDAHASWGAHWGAMVQYLERRAPCVYLPNDDWRHSCVCPLLSDGVTIVGIVDSADALNLDHVRRLGASWDAIVATDPDIARRVQAINPRSAARVVTIPRAVELPESFVPRPVVAGAALRVVIAGLDGPGRPGIVSQIEKALAEHGASIHLIVPGNLPGNETIELFRRSDAVLFLSASHRDWKVLVEAIGAGCVPVLMQGEALGDLGERLVQQGHTGYVVADGDVQGLARCLAAIQADPAARQRVAANAYNLAMVSHHRMGDVARDYVDVFVRAMGAAGHNRPATRDGVLSHPPAEIDGVGLFPVPLPLQVPGIGAFPCADPDYRQFVEQILPDLALAGRLPAPDEVEPLVVFGEAQRPGRGQAVATRLAGVPVIVSMTAWFDTTTTAFAGRLVRELRAAGVDAHILLTEDDTDRVRADAPRLPWPGDLPVARLPVDRTASWGAHWGGLVRYLEERAPCIWVPYDDWRHSCVAPLLSDRVIVAGIVANDDPLHRDHGRRLGRYWNALVVHDAAVAAAIADGDPTLAPRLSVVPCSEVDDRRSVGGAYARVFARALDEARDRNFVRPSGTLAPPLRVGDVVLFEVPLQCEVPGVGRFPAVFPDYEEFAREIHAAPGSPLARRLPAPEDLEPIVVFGDTARVGTREPMIERVQDVQVIVGSPSWTENGLNASAAQLVRQLRTIGIAAHILLTEEDTDHVRVTEARMNRPADIPFEMLPVSRSASWGAHWGAMLTYLERRAPCVYIPTYDWRHSCVSPLLSNRVAVVGVIHGDPLHYDHLHRLGRYWNAVVVHDPAVAAIVARDRAVAPRLCVLPGHAAASAAYYLPVFDRVFEELRTGRYVRPRGTLSPPPADVDGCSIFPVPLSFEKGGVGRFPRMDPDYAEFLQQTAALPAAAV